MAEFRFRAQAALDLRHKQEDAAATALGQAEAVFRRTAEQHAAKRSEREAALVQQLTDQQAGVGAALLEWHWNWINGLAGAVERLGRDLDARRIDVGVAEQAWREARRRRLVLERMRDRMLRRHQQEERRKELKNVDELARIRFINPETTSGGVNRGD
jgi:flagellar export protein FliJ